MSDIQTIGWTRNDKFFAVKVNHDVIIVDEDVRGICGVFNCEKFAGEYWGCRFVEKFALIVGDKVFVSAAVIDNDLCIDDPFQRISLSEFEKLKA